MGVTIDLNKGGDFELKKGELHWLVLPSVEGQRVALACFFVKDGGKTVQVMTRGQPGEYMGIGPRYVTDRMEPMNPKPAPKTCCCTTCGNCSKAPRYDATKTPCCCSACGHCFKAQPWTLTYPPGVRSFGDWPNQVFGTTTTRGSGNTCLAS